MSTPIFKTDRIVRGGAGKHGTFFFPGGIQAVVVSSSRLDMAPVEVEGGRVGALERSKVRERWWVMTNRAYHRDHLRSLRRRPTLEYESYL